MEGAQGADRNGVDAMSHTALMATTANGVEIVDSVDHHEADWLQFADFVESLRDLDDGECVYMLADPDEVEQIRKEYGIN